MGIFGSLSRLRDIDIGSVRGVGVVRGVEGGIAVASKELGRRGSPLSLAPLVEKKGKGTEDKQSESSENAAYDSADVCGFRRCAYCPPGWFETLASIKVCGCGNAGRHDRRSCGSVSVFDSITGNDPGRGE